MTTLFFRSPYYLHGFLRFGEEKKIPFSLDTHKKIDILFYAKVYLCFLFCFMQRFGVHVRCLVVCWAGGIDGDVFDVLRGLNGVRWFKHRCFISIHLEHETGKDIWLLFCFRTWDI